LSGFNSVGRYAVLKCAAKFVSASLSLKMVCVAFEFLSRIHLALSKTKIKATLTPKKLH
jgi:hypothetical protein